VKVTRAQLADVSQAAPLFAAYREFYGEPYDLEASASFLASRLARDESIVLIATDDDGRPVGFSQIYPAFSSTRLAPIWILNDLFVSDEARGTGVVDELLDAAATMAVDAGATAIELSTAHTNLRAQAVYDRSGYEVDTVFKHYEKPLP
jgi:ribosomal protein S18 acetylase RimI-like enzyme